MRVVIVSVAVLMAAFALAVAGGSITSGAAAVRALPPQSPAGFEPNSTQAVCALTGDHGAYTEQPQHYTVHRYGLISGDSGSSFEFDGKVWWLFGNTGASKHQPWGTTNVSSRWPDVASPPYTRASLDSDSIATSSETAGPPAPLVPYNDTTMPPDEQCPDLHFVTATGSVRGAPYVSPSVFPDPLFKTTKHFISLRRGELPEAGISEGNPAHMYVVFGTDNRANCLTVSTSAVKGPCQESAKATPSTTCVPAQKGSRTRSVMALYLRSPAEFEGLYDLSAPGLRYAPTCPTSPSSDAARFVNVQLQNGSDGYLYIWGTEGGANNDHSPVYLARMLAANIGTGAGIEYWDAHVSPARFVVGPQTKATPLFRDAPDPCAAQLGVQYNRYLDEWILLYHCNETPAPAGHPNGIYMRTAANPWGPWSRPTTIFNPDADPRTQSGDCYFIYSGQTCPADSLETKHELTGSTGTHQGDDYGPYFVANWTTGAAATSITQARTTIYYTLDTFNPYGQLILRSTILGPPVQPPPKCKGTPNPCG